MEPISPTNTPYRDEKATFAARLEKLHEELSVIRETKAEIEALATREKEIHTEIAELNKEIAKARTKRQLPLLELAYIASPCKADWNEMVGDERTRFCGSCQKNVHNVSDMSAAEAEAFLRNLIGDACVRMYRRKDGTVMTNDCPVGKRNKRIKRAAGALVGTGMAAAGFAAFTPRTGEVMVKVPVTTHEVAIQGGLAAPEATERPMPLGIMAFPPVPEKPKVTPPKRLSGPTKPENPAGVKGRVIARCTTTREGKTNNCRIMSGPSTMHQATLDMVAKQVYAPARIDGNPVDLTHTIRVDLDSPPSQTQAKVVAVVPNSPSKAVKETH